LYSAIYKIRTAVLNNVKMTTTFQYSTSNYSLATGSTAWGTRLLIDRSLVQFLPPICLVYRFTRASVIKQY